MRLTPNNSATSSTGTGVPGATSPDRIARRSSVRIACWDSPARSARRIDISDDEEVYVHLAGSGPFTGAVTIRSLSHRGNDRPIIVRHRASAPLHARR